MRRTRRARESAAAWLAAALLLAPAVAGCASGTARALHLSNGCAPGRRIALTFDDGPNPPWTQRLLELLRQKGAVATFFLVGDTVQAHPEVARALVDAGMEVGAHSWDHAEDLDRRDAASLDADLARMRAAFERALAFRPALYRAPHGRTSATMLRRLRAAGYVSVGWDIDARDWSDDDAETVVNNVLSKAHPNAIVLMHDGGRSGGHADRSTTLAALPRIIDGLRAQGYELATVSAISGVPERGPATEVTACSAS